MTGSTGIVGVPTLKKFIKNGDRVYCLVRRDGLTTGRERLLKKLKTKELPTNCFVLEGDITHANCGLNPGGIELLKLVNIDTVFHCAALTKMEEKNAVKSSKINVIGTHNVLTLANEIHAKKLHFISTAYVANGGSNVYEKTKKQAEDLVKLCSIPHVISRLSVVIGNSKTGEISDFSGMYGFFLAAYKMIKSSNYQTHLNVEAAPNTTLNLITTDWIADCLFKINNEKFTNLTLNIVDDAPMLVKDIINLGTTHLGIRQNINIQDRVDTDNKNVPTSQIIFNKVTEILRPYTVKNFSVNSSDLKEFLGNKYTSQSSLMNASTLPIALDYAIEASGLEEKLQQKTVAV